MNGFSWAYLGVLANLVAPVITVVASVAHARSATSGGWTNGWPATKPNSVSEPAAVALRPAGTRRRPATSTGAASSRGRTDSGSPRGPIYRHRLGKGGSHEQSL